MLSGVLLFELPGEGKLDGVIGLSTSPSCTGTLAHTESSCSQRWHTPDWGGAGFLALTSQ